jgi:hypothetical protein
MLKQSFALIAIALINLVPLTTEAKSVVDASTLTDWPRVSETPVVSANGAYVAYAIR